MESMDEPDLVRQNGVLMDEPLTDLRGGMYAPLRIPPHRECTARRSAGTLATVLLSCVRCHGHSLTLRGSVVQCDDCGSIQPTGAGGQGGAMARGAEGGSQKGFRVGQGHTNRKREETPKVGIVWVVGGRLVIEATPVNEAEEYGDFKIHPRDHCTVWGILQRAGTVPHEMEYEEPPRGRVMYNTKTRQYKLLADKCILSKKVLVTKIRSQMHLPKDTRTSTDEHYRCFHCLGVCEL